VFKLVNKLPKDIPMSEYLKEKAVGGWFVVKLFGEDFYFPVTADLKPLIQKNPVLMDNVLRDITMAMSLQVRDSVGADIKKALSTQIEEGFGKLFLPSLSQTVDKMLEERTNG